MKNLIPITVVLSLATSAARADLTVYTSRSAFTAASPGLHTIDFTGMTAGTPEGYHSLGLTGTIQGVTFSTTEPYPGGAALGILDPRFYDYSKSCNSGEYLYNNGGSSGIYMALPPNTMAFGADFFNERYTIYGWATSVVATVSITGGATYQFTARTSPSSTFWGFTSDTPVPGVLFYTSDWRYGGTYCGSIDNISFAVVPEPSAAVLFLLGLVLPTALSQRGCRPAAGGLGASGLAINYVAGAPVGSLRLQTNCRHMSPAANHCVERMSLSVLPR